MSDVSTCAKCRAREATGACVRCKNVFYCSEKCQRDDEAIHARLCHYTLGNSVPFGETELRFSASDSLKERIHKTLLAHRLDAFQMLALEVNENGDNHREEDLGYTLYESEVDAAKRFNETNGRSDAAELLYFVDGETMDTEGDSLYSGFTSSTCRILPYGPSPGVYTISAPSNPFVDKDHVTHPPLKRALILLLLSYWMDGQNPAKNKTLRMANIPYVRNVYTVNTGSRDALFLDLDKPRSRLIELDDFLGVYNKRSDRAEDLAARLKIGTVDAQDYEWLKSLLDARNNHFGPFHNGPMRDALDRIAKKVSSREKYTNQLANSMQRILDIMPDIHHAWRSDITDMITNLITQVIYTLWILQVNFECTLSNLTTSNIYLMHEPADKLPQFSYQIGATSLSVKNLGFRVVLMNFEHATLTVRLRSGDTSMIYSVITSKSIGRALAESLVPVEEIRSFSVQTSPTRFDPTRDIVTFFNSLSLEPRLGIHRHPVVTHFLAHEELSHVAAFGHNKLYRRVSLDQTPVVSVVRKLKKSSWADLTGETALAAFKIFRNVLAIESNTISMASTMETKIASSFSVLYEMIQRYLQAKKNQKAGSGVSLLAFVFQEKSLVARTLDAIGILRFYLLDPNNADVQMSWFRRFSESLSVIGDGFNILATYMFADVRGWISSWWTSSNKIDPTTLKSSTAESEADVIRYLDELIEFFIKKSTDIKSAAISAAVSKAMEVLTKGESSVFALARLGRQTAVKFIKAVVIQSGLDIAQYLLSRQLRFLLTRNVIMSGAAIPNVITFDRQRVAVTDMNLFIKHALSVGDNAKLPKRPRQPIIHGKIKRIIDNMPSFVKRLEEIRGEIDEKERRAKQAGKKTILSDDDAKARLEITNFFGGAQAPTGLVEASKIRHAAFTNPVDLVKYFGDPTAVITSSVITSELTRDNAMRFDGGAQGYVVGYHQQAGGKHGGTFAVKMTNAVSDILSLRPTEMTSAAITTATPINEAIVASIASQLYEDGISPHFLRYEGCAIARVHGKDAFFGRTGYNPDEMDNMIDEIVIDLLEHDNGMDVGTTITSMVNVMAVVLMEMVAALSISSMLPTINNIQKLLAVIQQSAEKTEAGSAVAKAFKLARESLDSFFRKNEPADASGATPDDDADYLGTVAETLTGDRDGTVTLYDQLQMARLLDIRMLLKWIRKQNPVMFLAAVDAIRRVIGLAAGVLSGNFSGMGDSSSGSFRPRGTASESLKMFAAYKARGVAALPARVRSHVEIWAKTMDIALDGSEAANTRGASSDTDKPADMFHVVSLMEAIDGSFNRFPEIVVAIQKALIEENDNGGSMHGIPTLDEYVDNAMAQVIFALAQFQTHLGGMHMDFHTANVFIKLCDNMLFNGKPLIEHEYWEYRIDGKLFRVPNMGFLVKIGDLGHASLSLQRTNIDKAFTVDITKEQTTRGKDYDGKNRLLVHKGTPAGIESLFGLDITPVRNLVNEVAELVPSVVPDGLNMADFANKIVSNLWLRQSGAFFPSYDLGHFMNSCAMLPFAYRSKLVLEYHTMECLRWIATYGSLDGMPMYSPNAYLPFLDKFKHPIAEKQLTTPLDMINESLSLASRYFVANEKA